MSEVWLWIDYRALAFEVVKPAKCKIIASKY